MTSAAAIAPMECSVNVEIAKAIAPNEAIAAHTYRVTQPLAAALRAGSRSFHAGAELRLAALGDWSGCAGAAVAARADPMAASPPSRTAWRQDHRARGGTGVAGHASKGHETK